MLLSGGHSIEISFFFFFSMATGYESSSKMGQSMAGACGRFMPPSFAASAAQVPGKSAKFVSVRAMASVWRSLCITCVVVCTAVRTDDGRATLAAEDASKHAEAVTLATDTFAEAVEDSCRGKFEDEKCQTEKKDSEGHFTYGKCHCRKHEHYGLAEVGLRRVYLYGLCKTDLVCK